MISLKKYDPEESGEEDHDIITSTTLQEMGCKMQMKGATMLKLNSEIFCKGTKMIHTQIDGFMRLYRIVAYGSSKCSPALQDDMEPSDTLLAVVKKMEKARLTIAELIDKLSRLDSIAERDEFLFQEIAFIIRPRADDRTMRIAQSILNELRGQGPKLINTMYEEKLMSVWYLNTCTRSLW